MIISLEVCYIFLQTAKNQYCRKGKKKQLYVSFVIFFIDAIQYMYDIYGIKKGI